MERITLTSRRLNDVKRNLHKYYNYEISDKTSSEIPLDIATDINLIRLRESYRQLIGNEDREIELIDTLATVSHYMSSDSLGMSVSIYHMLDEMIRSDLLRLYIMLYDSSPQTTWISIRTINGTIRLRNYCNWFQDDMIKNYLKKIFQIFRTLVKQKVNLKKISVLKVGFLMTRDCHTFYGAHTVYYMMRVHSRPLCLTGYASFCSYIFRC